MSFDRSGRFPFLSPFEPHPSHRKNDTIRIPVDLFLPKPGKLFRAVSAGFPARWDRLPKKLMSEKWHAYNENVLRIPQRDVERDLTGSDQNSGPGIDFPAPGG
jgi:hypothetical protein